MSYHAEMSRFANDDLVTSAEAAQALGLRLRQLRYARERGRLVPDAQQGRAWLYSQATIERYQREEAARVRRRERQVKLLTREEAVRRYQHLTHERLDQLRREGRLDVEETDRGEILFKPSQLQRAHQQLIREAEAAAGWVDLEAAAAMAQCSVALVKQKRAAEGAEAKRVGRRLYVRQTWAEKLAKARGAELSRRCEECQQPFIALRSGQRFHSNACYQRNYRRESRVGNSSRSRGRQANSPLASAISAARSELEAVITDFLSQGRLGPLPAIGRDAILPLVWRLVQTEARLGLRTGQLTREEAVKRERGRQEELKGAGLR